MSGTALNPRVDRLNAGVAELSRIPCHDCESTRGSRCRKEGIRHMIVERLASPPPVLHYSCARSGI